MTVSSLAALLVNAFLPESYQKYLLRNYQMSGTYRAYKDFVPSYLHGRPRNVIVHCLSRKSKCAKIMLTQVICTDSVQGIFEINSSSGKKHTVSFCEPQCSCKDWKQQRLPCKHFFAVFHYFSDWSWDRLPVNYLASEYLTSDTVTPAAASDAVNSDDHEEVVFQDSDEQEAPKEMQDEIPKMKVYCACIFLLRHYVEAINANVHAVDLYIFIRRLYLHVPFLYM